MKKGSREWVERNRLDDVLWIAYSRGKQLTEDMKRRDGMLLTICLREVAGEPEVPLFFQDYDGFLWLPIILGLGFGLQDEDSSIFCTSSRVLGGIVLRRFRNVKQLGSVLKVPKFQQLFVLAPPSQVVETLGCLGNPIAFEARKAMGNLH